MAVASCGRLTEPSDAGGGRRQRPPEIFQAHDIGGRNMENRRESLVAFVLFIALLFFCILMGLVPLLAGTTERADSITFEHFYQASLDTSAGNTSFDFVVDTFSQDDAFYDPTLLIAAQPAVADGFLNRAIDLLQGVDQSTFHFA